MSCTTSSATVRPYSVKLVCRTWEQQALRNHHMVLSPFSWPTLPAESTCNLKCTLKPPRGLGFRAEKPPGRLRCRWGTAASNWRMVDAGGPGPGMAAAGRG